MRSFSPSASPKPASSVGLYTFVMPDVERSVKSISEVSLDDGINGKEIAVRLFDQQTYRRKKTLLYHFSGR